MEKPKLNQNWKGVGLELVEGKAQPAHGKPPMAVFTDAKKLRK